MADAHRNCQSVLPSDSSASPADAQLAGIVKLQTGPIDIEAVIEAVRDAEAGAVAVFVGTVRRSTSGREVEALHFEACPQMAEAEMRRIVAEACTQFGLRRCALVHRIGLLKVGEIIVVAAASAPHREAAFAATSWLVERLKISVPIWKKEIYRDGQAAWIHPGWSDPSEANAE